jgi:membrane-associated protein
MFDAFFNFMCLHAPEAHYYFFGLLLLAGVNIPVSEDLILMAGGIIVAICIPEHYYLMLGWLYAGCLFSAYEAYWLGHTFGRQLYTLPGFRHIITPTRMQNVHRFIERFGVLTFMVGRFIPGGVRNAIFISSGLGRMPFWVFACRDGFAAIFSTWTFYQLGHLFGDNYPILFDYVTTYHHIVLLLVGLLVGSGLACLWYHHHYGIKE